MTYDYVECQCGERFVVDQLIEGKAAWGWDASEEKSEAKQHFGKFFKKANELPSGTFSRVEVIQ